MNRRRFSLVTGTTALATSFGIPSISGQDQKSGLVIDAMGELRSVYSKELIREMIDSGLNSITVTVCDPKTYEENARKAANAGLEEYNALIDKHPDLLIRGNKSSKILMAREERKIAVFYLFQNSTPMGRDLSRVDDYYERGVRSIQLTYNYQNWAGAGCKEINGAGLTVFGKELIEKMNNRNILVDLSHANMTTMKDAIDVSTSSVIVSHTGCMSVHENIRNTTDENLKALADKGGVVGICQIRPFITNLRKGAFEKYLDHIEHALNVAGENGVGIGSDRDHRRVAMTDEYMAELRKELGPLFNENDFPLYMDELNGPGRMRTVMEGLQRRRVPSRIIDKVMGGNIHRIYSDVIG